MLYGYGLAASVNPFVIRERGPRKRKTDGPKNSSSLLFLEEEIRLLRNRMEELFEQEQSLTSPPVVEASSQLDLKINEYMQTKGSC